MERLSVGGLQADLILIDAVRLSLEDALNVGQRIGKHAKQDDHTPLAVMAEEYGAELEGTNVNVSDNDWITYLEETGQLKNLPARLRAKSSN